MAWGVELADSAAKQLRKLDPQIATRILTFLRDRQARRPPQHQRVIVAFYANDGQLSAIDIADSSDDWAWSL